jgi:hypothetical protein
MDECVESDYLNSRPCMSHADACEHDFVVLFKTLSTRETLHLVCLHVCNHPFASVDYRDANTL